jgi:hypothetical protein
MATSKFQFAYTSGQTLVAKAMSIAGTAYSNTSTSVTEAPASSGVYIATFTESSALNGTFRVVLTLGGVGVASFEAKWTGVDGQTVSGSEFVNVDVSGLGGSGSITYELTVKSSGTPVAGVECWVSTDSAGTNVVAGTLTTNDFGVVTFLLDAGTYYLWRDSTTHTFPKPTTITVS